MSKSYMTLSGADALRFLSDKGVRNVGVHALTERICHWLYCKRCGLVNLKNDATRKALREPCVVWE